MRNLILFEIKKSYKPFAIITASIGAMVFLSMMFYTTMAENMSELQGFLSSGFMMSILGAFGIDPAAMKSVLGFYTVYSSMFVLLVGGTFFAFYSAGLIWTEEDKGTMEYTAACPLGRLDIFLGKYIVLMIFSVAFIVVLSLMSIIGIETQTSDSPYQVYESNISDELKTDIRRNSEKISEIVELNEDDFSRFTMGVLMDRYTSSKEEIEAEGIDAQRIMNVLSDELNDPEALFEKMANEPEKYMDLLGLKDISADDFKSAIGEEAGNYSALKELFLHGDDVYKQLFDMDGGFFIGKWIEQGKVDEIDNVLGGRLTSEKAIAKYLVKDFIMIQLNMLALIVMLGTIAFGISGFLGKKYSAPTISLGYVLVSYFANSFIEFTPFADKLKYITPFGYISVDINEVYGNSNLMTIAIGLMLTYTLLILGYRRFKTRDLV